MSLPPFNNRVFRRSQLPDQQFGMELDPEGIYIPIFPFEPLLSPMVYHRTWIPSVARSDAGSTINYGRDNFEIKLDVQHFAPNEVTVKIKGDNIIEIEAHHEEKQDEQGFISRHFIRKYLVPAEYDIAQVQSNLSSDGILIVNAPKKITEAESERIVPIQQTGGPGSTEGNQGDSK